MPGANINGSGSSAGTTKSLGSPGEVKRNPGLVVARLPKFATLHMSRPKSRDPGYMLMGSIASSSNHIVGCVFEIGVGFADPSRILDESGPDGLFDCAPENFEKDPAEG